MQVDIIKKDLKNHLSGPTPENSSDFSSANATQIACMPENFNELAQRYIQVRMPPTVDGASTSVDGLDTWGKLLSATNLGKATKC